MTRIHEFMTGWNSQDNGFKPSVWAERAQERLLGTARSTRAIPHARRSERAPHSQCGASPESTSLLDISRICLGTLLEMMRFDTTWAN